MATNIEKSSPWRASSSGSVICTWARCTSRGRLVQGRHPVQTSDAIGTAAAQLAAQVIGLVVVLNKQLGLTFAKIATLLQQLYGLTLTRRALVHAVHWTSRPARPTSDALCAHVLGSPMGGEDETGQESLACCIGSGSLRRKTRPYTALRPGGCEEAAAVLGADVAGVLVRDDWAFGRQFTAGAHQTCLAHLLRRCRLVAADHPHARFATDVQAILQQALAVRDRFMSGELSAAGLATARGQSDRPVLLDRPQAIASRAPASRAG